MIQILRPLPRAALGWSVGRSLAIGIALVMLLGALITPWGLTKSHGAAALLVVDHGETWHSDHQHGHSHADDSLVLAGIHAHHTGDHTHDHVYTLPVGVRSVSKATAVWQERLVQSGPWPSLDGIERPPRA